MKKIKIFAFLAIVSVTSVHAMSLNECRQACTGFEQQCKIVCGKFHPQEQERCHIACLHGHGNCVSKCNEYDAGEKK